MSGIVPGPDPSMEEILASIRRILDTDPQEVEAKPAPLAAAGLPLPPVDDDEDELLLDDSMLVQPPPPPVVQPPVVQPVVAPPAVAPSFTPFAAPAVPPAAPAAPDPVPKATPMPADPAPADAAPPPGPGPAPGLLGPAAADVTVSSMMSLVRAVASERGAAVYRGGPTIEELVREEIRPLLKDWLDSYLPPLVERLVRIEIERVVGRVAP